MFVWGSKWRKEHDILDVWFDAGSSTSLSFHGNEWPADIYLEGPDQYRGWFHSSLLIGIGSKQATVSRRGDTWLDAGRAGRTNVEVAGQHRAANRDLREVGRGFVALWVASQEYQADVKMSDRVMTQLSEAYRKIRNTFRFALGNLNEFDPAGEACRTTS